MKNQHPPTLLRVPSTMTHELTLRLSLTGVTQLKDGSYKKRYTGGECIVDINGKLHLSKKDYIAYSILEDQARADYLASLGFVKKKPRKISNEKPGETKVSSGAKDTPKKERVKKSFHINAAQVGNRVYSMVEALVKVKKSNTFLGFVTVSFPPCVNDDTAYIALNTWLTTLRQKNKRLIKQYLWIAERQDGKRRADGSPGTNTIHYHFLIPHYINIQAANRKMMIILCNMVRKGVIKYDLAAMKRYNGVDLAKDRRGGKKGPVINFAEPVRRKSLVSYITKYVTKNSSEFSHPAWHCSRGFSALFTGITCTYQEFCRVDWFCNAFEDPVIMNKWFDFFPWRRDTGPPLALVHHLADLNAYILSEKSFLN